MAGTYCGKWADLHGENGGVKDEHSKNIGTVKIRSAGTRMCELYGADKAEENIRRYEDLVQKFRKTLGRRTF